MDRISKAVERARKEREAKKKQFTEIPEEINLDFTQTRTVRISKQFIKENRIITEDSNDSFTHAYKVLRTRVWQQIRTNGWNLIAVTSCNPGEGKTLTAINLSISLAMMKANHSVLLVDLDLRRPSIHKYFGLNVEYGIADYLLRGQPLSDILINPSIGRFVLLTGNHPLPNSSEVLASPRLDKLVAELKNRYSSRIIIFDLPPLLYTDDVLVFLHNIDAVLMVIEEGVTKKEDLLRAKAMIKETNLMGTVLNKSEVQPRTTYY